MARQASSKPDSGSSSTATIGFEAHFHSFSIRHSDFVIHPAPRLAIRGIEADIGKDHADTFRNVQHPDLRADYVLSNPPFKDSDWFRRDSWPRILMRTGL
jgi:23S rRNA A1618 N6-methylase RlmF